MAAITTGAFKLDFLAIEISEVVLRRIGGEVLDNGKIAPAVVGGHFLHEQINASDVVGKGRDVVEHGPAHDILLGADQSGVGDGYGFSFVEEAARQLHAIFYFRFGQPMSAGARVRRQRNDGRSPLLVDPLKSDRRTEFDKLFCGKTGQVQWRLFEQSGAGGIRRFDERRSVVRRGDRTVRAKQLW